jgi:hypothetical protein
VNTSSDTLAVPSPASLLATGIVTSVVGSLVSTTSNDAVAPASLVVRPAVGVTVMPAASSSVLITATSAGSMPAKLASLLVAGSVSIV